MTPSNAICEAAKVAKIGLVRSANRSAVDLTPALTSSLLSCTPGHLSVLPCKVRSFSMYSGLQPLLHG